MDLLNDARRLASIGTYFIVIGWIFVIYALIAGVIWWIDLAQREAFNFLEALAISLRENGIDPRTFPIVIRLFGPAEAEARALAAQFPGIRYLPRGASLAEACREIVQAVASLAPRESSR